MIGVIARKEFLDIRRDGRFAWTAAIVLLLLAAALALGLQSANQVKREQAQAQTLERETWLNLGEQNQHDAAHFGRYVFKPQSAVGFFDDGVNPYLGIAVWTAAHVQETANFRPAEDQVSSGRFGALTAAVVLQLLVPLVIILFAYSSLAGERESGTLRQVLSLGVSARTLLLGKAVGIVAALALLLVPAAMIGAVVLLVSGEQQLSGDDFVWRFALLAVVYLLYFAVFVWLALAVSAIARSSRIALLILLAFWIVNGFVAPRLASTAAQSFYPATYYADFWAMINRDLKEGMDGHDPQSKRAEELKKRTLEKYNVARVEDLPISFEGLSLEAGEEYGDAVFDRHYGELWATFERQNRIHEAGAIIAPLLSVRSLSMNFAGTDFYHHRDFARQAESYRRAFVKTLNQDMTSKNGRILNGKTIADRSLWERVSDFVYTPPRFGTVLANGFLSFALLLAWFVAAAAAAFISVARIRAD